MALTQLVQHRVEKVWGRRDLPDIFGGEYSGAEPLGEIWFEHPDRPELDLLVKYLFTSEKLSIQVHPDDDAARRAGYKSGKDEAWLVLSAEDDAVIGMGLREHVTSEAFRKAALDGTIESLVDWRSVGEGDVFYSPAGTVHALGAGLALIEIQQNVDLTYRLYDYGRPRELHLEEGIAAARLFPYFPSVRPHLLRAGREVLVDGPAFVIERWSHPTSGIVTSGDRPIWLIPTQGIVAVHGQTLEPGTIWLLEGAAEVLVTETAHLLVAYAGAEIFEALLT